MDKNTFRFESGFNDLHKKSSALPCPCIVWEILPGNLENRFTSRRTIVFPKNVSESETVFETDRNDVN